MAITDLPTFTVNGVLSSDYGIYVLRTNDEDFPERDYESVEIPNRTGNLILDNGRWKNKYVVYNCVCFNNPSKNVPLFIGVFTKTGTDVRIEDTINPDYMKLGKFTGGTTPKFKPYKTAATFDLVFDCDPRKWDISNASAGYDAWTDLTVGGEKQWSGTQTYFVARYIAPRFRVREVERISFGMWNGSMYVWREVAHFRRLVAAVVEYDTETLHASVVSTGASIDEAIDARYVPKLCDVVCPIGCDNFRIGIKPYDGATAPTAQVNFRSFAL